MADKIVNSGLAIITNLMTGAGTEPTYVGVGVGTTAPAAGNTDLETASAVARVNGTSSRVTTTATNDTYQVAATVSFTGSLAITEAGSFDGAGAGSPPSGDNLYSRHTFSAINVVNGDSISFTIKSAFASA